MQADTPDMSDESAVERLVGLAGTEHVSGYQRHGKHVSSYFRSPGKMSAKDIVGEIGSLSAQLARGRDPRASARLTALNNEKSKRQRAGTWKFEGAHKSSVTPGSGLAKHQQLMNADAKAGKDDFGKSAAKQLSDAELDDAIKTRADLNAKSSYGMSGEADLKVLQNEKSRRGGKHAKAPVANEFEDWAKGKKGTELHAIANKKPTNNSEALDAQVAAKELQRRLEPKSALGKRLAAHQPDDGPGSPDIRRSIHESRRPDDYRRDFEASKLGTAPDPVLSKLDKPKGIARLKEALTPYAKKDRESRRRYVRAFDSMADFQDDINSDRLDDRFDELQHQRKTGESPAEQEQRYAEARAKQEAERNALPNAALEAKRAAHQKTVHSRYVEAAANKAGVPVDKVAQELARSHGINTVGAQKSLLPQDGFMGINTQEFAKEMRNAQRILDKPHDIEDDDQQKYEDELQALISKALSNPKKLKLTEYYQLMNHLDYLQEFGGNYQDDGFGDLSAGGSAVERLINLARGNS